jgi:hypothetical protein
MPEYSNSKIYKIVCNKTGAVYVGSTTQKLCVRLSSHRRDYKRYLNGKYSFVSSFNIIKNEDYDIVLIESFSCETKEELHKKERHYIESLECVNKNIPTRTDLEYRDANKDKIRQYREVNKDKLKVVNKEYRDANKDKIKDMKKEYNDSNKEKIKEYMKAYYEKKKKPNVL